jgi:hypothetical protein
MKLRRLRRHLLMEETRDVTREDQESRVVEAVLRAAMDMVAEDHHSATYPKVNLSGLLSHPWRQSYLDWHNTLLVIVTLVKSHQSNDSMTIILRNSNAANQRLMRHTGKYQFISFAILNSDLFHSRRW